MNVTHSYREMGILKITDINFRFWTIKMTTKSLLRKTHQSAGIIVSCSIEREKTALTDNSKPTNKKANEQKHHSLIRYRSNAPKPSKLLSSQQQVIGFGLSVFAL